LIDRILDLMHVELSATTTTALRSFATAASWWERVDLIALILLTPDLNTA
jgi:hypothetical protein